MTLDEIIKCSEVTVVRHIGRRVISDKDVEYGFFDKKYLGRTVTSYYDRGTDSFKIYIIGEDTNVPGDYAHQIIHKGGIIYE